MTDIATKARAAAASFECKKHALRQTQNGEWIISFTALDLPTWLVTAHMGTRLMNAVVEIADDETPVEHAKVEVVHCTDGFGNASGLVRVPRETRGEQESGAPKVDTNHPRNSAASERYRQKDAMEQAVTRAAMMCKSPTYQMHAIEQMGGIYYDDTKFRDKRYTEQEKTACTYLYQSVVIDSRTDIGSNEGAYQRFLAHETDWKLISGQLPEIR